MKTRYSSQKTLTGVCALGAALPLLLSGCGGTSYQKQSFGTYPDAGPVAYGLEATAVYGFNNSGGDPSAALFYQTSGPGTPDNAAAFISGATAFSVVSGAGPLPNSTTDGKIIPLGFSPGGFFIDKGATVPTAVTPGSSVVFRAAISNGISSATRSSIPIQFDGVTLSSTDPQWTLGTLPMTFNFTKTGPLANGTYVTGTPVQSGQGTPTAFTVPFTTTGLHTLTVSVSDANGQKTQTTYSVPVLANGDALVLAEITDADGLPVAGATAAITGADAPGYVAPGATAPADPDASVSDAQGCVVLFAAPGATQTAADGTAYTNTITVTNVVPASGTNPAVTQTATLNVTLTPGAALSTDGGAPITITPAAPAAAGAARHATIRRSVVRRH